MGWLKKTERVKKDGSGWRAKEDEKNGKGNEEVGEEEEEMGK